MYFLKIRENEKLDWLEETLKNAEKNKEYVFIIGHSPPFSFSTIKGIF